MLVLPQTGNKSHLSEYQAVAVVDQQLWEAAMLHFSWESSILCRSSSSCKRRLLPLQLLVDQARAYWLRNWEMLAGALRPSPASKQ